MICTPPMGSITMITKHVIVKWWSGSKTKKLHWGRLGFVSQRIEFEALVRCGIKSLKYFMKKWVTTHTMYTRS
ncbi:hypothetical protein HanIR_Chr03g0119581 [Helianthus annuus]|nr:hypothetical protein HanIR_Chr03g0119581 [Helianthus annuus]